MPAPVISELSDVPLASDTLEVYRSKSNEFVDSIGVFYTQINLLVDWLNSEYYSEIFSVNYIESLSSKNQKDIFDSSFFSFAQSINTFVQQLNFVRFTNGLNSIDEMPAPPSLAQSKSLFDSAAFSWINALSMLPSIINSLSWGITDWTSGLFWSGFNCDFYVDDGISRWQYFDQGIGSNNLMVLTVTSLGPKLGWQEGFRPSSVTLVINSGANSGGSDEIFDSLSAEVRDNSGSLIGSQTYSFSEFNQSISHTIALTFSEPWDIYSILLDQTIYLETDGPYIEQVVFNE